MSEQDRKRAEEVWRSLWSDGTINHDMGNWTKPGPITTIAIALAQARREGMEAFLSAAREEQYVAVESIGEDSEWVVRILDLEGRVIRLLAKEEGR